jgi:hypothetical protein
MQMKILIPLLILFFQLNYLIAQKSISIRIGENSSVFFESSNGTSASTNRSNSGLIVSTDYQFTNKKFINWNLAFSFQSKNGLNQIEYRAPGGGFRYNFDVKMMYMYLSFYPEFYFEKLRFLRLSTGPQIGVNVFTKGTATIQGWEMDSIYPIKNIENITGFFKMPDFRWFAGIGIDIPIADFTKLSFDVRSSMGFSGLASFGNGYFPKLKNYDISFLFGLKRWF